jgi:hypothetical protein
MAVLRVEARLGRGHRVRGHIDHLSEIAKYPVE